MHAVGTIFNYLYNQENILRQYEHNRLPSACQNFSKTMGDIDPWKMNDDLCDHCKKKQRSSQNSQ